MWEPATKETIGWDSGGTKGLRASCWRVHGSGTVPAGTCLHVFGWEIG